MAEIVNLRRVRKSRARSDKEARASENRTRFGRTRAERDAEAAASTQTARDLDGRKLDRPETDGETSE